MALVNTPVVSITPTLNDYYFLIGLDSVNYQFNVADTNEYVIFPKTSGTGEIEIENPDVVHATLGSGKRVRNQDTFKMKGKTEGTSIIRVYRYSSNTIDPNGDWYFESTRNPANPVYTQLLPTYVAGDNVSTDLFYKIVSNLLVIQKTFGAKTGVVSFTEGAVMVGNSSGGIGELIIPLGNMVVGGSNGAEALAPGGNGQVLGVVGGSVVWTGAPNVGNYSIDRISMGYF